MNNTIDKKTVEKTNEFINKIIDVPVENISFDSNIPLDADITDSNKVYKGNVSVLFADMRNSTKFTDDNTAKTVVKVYRSYIKTITSAIRFFNGNVRDFMGDGVLAVFSDKEIDGVMVSSAEQAVSAGKMICTLIDYCLNPKLKEKFNRIIGCGIGICTGTVLATKVGMRGNEGKPDVENETGIIWIGSCTNYASKYCGVANAGEIVIDKKTYSNITDNANWRLTQKIKGDVIYSCFVSQQNYMDIETDNEAICLGTDIVHSSVGVQINETILTNIERYEKQIRELTILSQELEKKQKDLSKKESELIKESNRQKQEAERLKQKEQRVNQEYYNNLARIIEDAHCKREYVIKCGEDFWDKQLEKTISAGEKIGKTKLDVEIELCYALEDIYENLNSWEKAYNYLCIQAEYYSWIHSSTVEKCIIESHCFARIKRIIEKRLQPSVPYNLGKDLEKCKEVIKKLGYWT